MFISSSLYLLVASLYAALALAADSAQFVGCSKVAGDVSQSFITGSSDPVGDCNILCSKFSYSLTQTPSNSQDPVACTCTNTLSSTITDYASSSNQACAPQEYLIQDVSTVFAYQACYPLTDLDPAKQFASQPDLCFSTCQKTGSYAFTSQSSTGSWDCLCTSTVPTSTPSDTCEPSHNYISYYYDFQTQPSHDANHRRNLKARVEKRRRELVEILCPADLVACRVEGVDAYECLDVQAELDSCGGCMYGIYTTARTPAIPASARPGTDCGSISGIPMGAVTCSSGECLASACKKGWTLVMGQCVKVAAKKAKRSKK